MLYTLLITFLLLICKINGNTVVCPGVNEPYDAETETIPRRWSDCIETRPRRSKTETTSLQHWYVRKFDHCQQSAVNRFRSQPLCSGTLCQMIMTFSLHHQFLPSVDF